MQKYQPFQKMASGGYVWRRLLTVLTVVVTLLGCVGGFLDEGAAEVELLDDARLWCAGVLGV